MAKSEHFDVIIVGAGISGVGGAYHLQDQCPGTSYVVLETQGSFGGTWLTHTYPGIRSDSDLYTFGYRFKPWLGKPIATAAEIRDYMNEVIEENRAGQWRALGRRIVRPRSSRSRLDPLRRPGERPLRAKSVSIFSPSRKLVFSGVPFTRVRA